MWSPKFVADKMLYRTVLDMQRHEIGGRSTTGWCTDAQVRNSIERTIQEWSRRVRRECKDEQTHQELTAATIHRWSYESMYTIQQTCRNEITRLRKCISGRQAQLERERISANCAKNERLRKKQRIGLLIRRMLGDNTER